MSKTINIEQIEQMLWTLGERWRELQSRPLSPEEMRQAMRAVRRARALKEWADQLGIPVEALKALADRFQRLAEAIGDWHGVGWLHVESPPPSSVLAAAGLEPPASAPREWSGWSADQRLRARCRIDSNQEVWLAFETEDPALADRTVAFVMIGRPSGRILGEGQVRLQPAGPQKWAGLRFNGMAWDLTSPLDVVFAVHPED